MANLLADPKVAAKAKATLPGLRWVLRNAIDMGIPCPALMASLSYIDSLRTGPLPTNLIQALRDFFGAHTYERTDAARDVPHAVGMKRLVSSRPWAAGP